MHSQAKRSSLTSNKHCNSVCSVDTVQVLILETEKIEKGIQFIHHTLRAHLKDKEYSFQETQLKEMSKVMSYVRKNHTKMHEQHESSLAAVRNDISKVREEKDQSIKLLTLQFEQWSKSIQSEHNQKILQINAEFGQRQQAYKQLIANFIQSLNRAQKMYSCTYSQLANKCIFLAKYIQQSMAANSENQHVAQLVQQIVEDINLRHENSMISEKSDQISLDEIEMSCKKESKQIFIRDDHCFDASSIEKELVDEAEEGEGGHPPNSQKLIEIWLRKLICFGFFSKQNAENVSRLLSMTQSKNHYINVLKDARYPILLQLMRITMMNNEELAWDYINDQISCDLDEDDNKLRVELRNIENMCELSVADSQQSNRFKKK